MTKKDNEKTEKILLEQLTTNYTKNTFNIDSQLIDFIEKHNDDDSISVPEYINLVLCDQFGISKKKAENLAEYFRLKLESENLDDFQTMIYYAQVERCNSIEDLTELILGSKFGKIQMRRLNLMLKSHFEEVKNMILNIFSEDLKRKIEKIKKGDI